MARCEEMDLTDLRIHTPSAAVRNRGCGNDWPRLRGPRRWSWRLLDDIGGARRQRSLAFSDDDDATSQSDGMRYP